MSLVLHGMKLRASSVLGTRVRWHYVAKSKIIAACTLRMLLPWRNEEIVGGDGARNGVSRLKVLSGTSQRRRQVVKHSRAGDTKMAGEMQHVVSRRWCV